MGLYKVYINSIFPKGGKKNLFDDNFDTKKSCSLDKKNVDFKKLKNLHFSKGVSPWFWSKN